MSDVCTRKGKKLTELLNFRKCMQLLKFLTLSVFTLNFRNCMQLTEFFDTKCVYSEFQKLHAVN